jgi:hypothetical protein
MGGRGIEQGGKERDFVIDFWGWRRWTWSVEKRNGERSIFIVCDFNGR